MNKYFYYYQGTAGSQAVTVTVGSTSQTASSTFTYDNNLTPQISGLSPRTTTVIGELGLILAFINYIHPFNNLSLGYREIPG